MPRPRPGKATQCALGAGLALLLLGVECRDAAPPDDALRALSFNVYGIARPGPHAWEARRERVAQLLREEMPEILALQEALAEQLDWLVARFPHYRILGQHREGGRRGEFSGLLVDTRRLRVLEAGEFWLSEQPERAASVGWDARIPRICVWATLRDEASGEHLRVFATHLDHRGRRARLESARLMAQRMLDGRPPEAGPALPTLLLGDLNAAPDSPPLAVLSRAGLQDGFRTLHPEATPVGTLHRFRGEESGPRIDYVLHSSGPAEHPHWELLEARILRPPTGQAPASDHYPVLAVLRLRPHTTGPRAAAPPSESAP